MLGARLGRARRERLRSALARALALGARARLRTCLADRAWPTRLADNAAAVGLDEVDKWLDYRLLSRQFL